MKADETTSITSRWYDPTDARDQTPAHRLRLALEKAEAERERADRAEARERADKTELHAITAAISTICATARMHSVLITPDVLESNIRQARILAGYRALPADLLDS